jgi:hypothetical protein
MWRPSVVNGTEWEMAIRRDRREDVIREGDNMDRSGNVCSM